MPSQPDDLPFEVCAPLSAWPGHLCLDLRNEQPFTQNAVRERRDHASGAGNDDQGLGEFCCHGVFHTVTYVS
jgi:hypothetical protein